MSSSRIRMDEQLSTLSAQAWRASPAATAETLSRGQWHRAKHLDYISKILTRELLKPKARVMIFTPPRHGKSEFCSLYTPIWGMRELRRPRPPRVGVASYSGKYALTWGRAARNTVQANTRTLGFSVRSDNAANSEWETTRGASMITSGIDGAFTGRGLDLLDIDDPVKNWKDAYSALKRDASKEWYRSTARTRLEPGAAILLIMTRWHEDDLGGWLLREAERDGEQWVVIKLPAIAEENDPLGRAPGEALWPERYDEDELSRIKSAVGDFVWSALFQQSPLSAGLRMFPASAWRFYPIQPPVSFFDRILVSIDSSFKDAAASSYVSMQVWGLKTPRMFLLDHVHLQMDFTRTLHEIRGLKERWPNAIGAWFVEEKANGSAILSSLEMEIPGMIPVKVHGDKIARAAAVQPFVAAGNVVLPSPDLFPWVAEFLRELHEFPAGAHDDQVDAFSQALERTFLSGVPDVDPAAFNLEGLLMGERWT
jgi:predicted phage terminase large subunit-like protein